jgi:hypothetical protein
VEELNSGADEGSQESGNPTPVADGSRCEDGFTRRKLGTNKSEK